MEHRRPIRLQGICPFHGKPFLRASAFSSPVSACRPRYRRGLNAPGSGATRIGIAACTFESRQLGFRQGIEEGLRDLELAAVGTKPTLYRLGRDRGQARHRSLAAHDYDLLAVGRTPDQVLE